MSRWFRFYDDAMNDPKVQRLPGEKFKAWVNMLCLASKNNGSLPTLADIAFSLRMSEEKVSSLLDEFCASLLLDPIELVDAPMSYEPHNWNARQYKSDVTDPTAAKRQKAYRDRNADRNATVTVTAPRTDTEQIQKTEQKKERRADALVVRDPSEFEIFWAAWPHRVGKSDAVKKFASARKRASLEEILAGVQRYIRDKPPDRDYLNPATFLNQNRWEDQPAKVQHGKVPAENSLISSINRAIDYAERKQAGDTEVLEVPFRRISA